MALLSVLKINAKMVDLCMWSANLLLQQYAIILQELNFTSTIWQPSCEEFFCFFYSNEKVFYNFSCYIINENVQTSYVVFYSIQNLKGYVKKYYRFKQLFP
jgi:hypothetical protein